MIVSKVLFDPPEREVEAYIRAYEQFYAHKTGKTVPEPQKDHGIEEKDSFYRQARADLLNDLYKNLDTLDGKASGLLAYSGLIIAGSTLLLGSPIAPESPLPIYFIAALAGLAAFLALDVIGLKWTSAEEIGGRTLWKACSHYYSVRRYRTSGYRLGWSLIAIATGSFLLTYILGFGEFVRS